MCCWFYLNRKGGKIECHRNENWGGDWERKIDRDGSDGEIDENFFNFRERSDWGKSLRWRMPSRTEQPSDKTGHQKVLEISRGISIQINLWNCFLHINDRKEQLCRQSEFKSYHVFILGTKPFVPKLFTWFDHYLHKSSLFWQIQFFILSGRIFDNASYIIHY